MAEKGIIIAWLTLLPAVVLGGGLAHGAPLDEFLTAQHGYPPWHGEWEVGMDVMNGKLDLLNLRKKDQDFSGTTVGDYTGWHALGGIAVTRRLWVDGGVWDRSIMTPLDTAESVGWQVGAQYQFTVNVDNLPALALRWTRWGNSGQEVEKKSATTLRGITADKIAIKGPGDRQTQIDLLATWMRGENDSFSLFYGQGWSKVNYDKLLVTLRGECVYDVDSPNPQQFKGFLVSGDPDFCEVLSFDLHDEGGAFPGKGMGAAYDARYVHFGGMYQWLDDKWRTRLGMRFQKHDRDVEDSVHRFGRTTYDNNLTIVGDVGYKIFKESGLVFRIELMKNQFVGDIPFTYNTFSSNRFNRKYGFLTIAWVSGF
ncbi:MAG: hypothetical protein HQL56_00110 [Magnetococcales bacterium]|nr:hypothetical protein [Magnetococcales bacterium]